MINDMGIMTNNLRTVVNLSVFFLTMCCHNFLTFLNVGGVNNDIIFFMTLFPVILLRFLVTLFVWLAEALKVVMGSIFMFVVSMTRLSFSLVISMRMMINNMCVMTNNLFTVMSFMMFLVTLSDEFFITIFNVCGINNGLTFSSRNFSLMLLGNLMALMIYMVLAVWSRRVTLVTSLSLVISMRMMINHLRVMTNNLRTVVYLGVLFLTMCGDNFLTFLNVCSIYNNIIFFMTHFSVILLWFLVTFFVWLAEALEVVMFRIMVFFMVSMTRLRYRCKDCCTSKEESCTQFVHHI